MDIFMDNPKKSLGTYGGHLVVPYIFHHIVDSKSEVVLKHWSW